MSQSFDILVVDDEANMRRVLCALVRQQGHRPIACSSAEEALACLAEEDPAIVLSDLKMGGMDGLELMDRLKQSHPELPVVMITAFGSIDIAVGAMKRGAFDFVTKPFDRERVLAVMAKALAQSEASRRDFQGPLVAGERCGILGRSSAIEELRQLIERAAPSDATILVTGETGTGKELVAEAVHRLSKRSEGPLVKINCGALPESLVESELFGHAKGAFTGAAEDRPGRCELADGGTLFLDEIGELTPAAQVKLLRVLQDGTIDPVGGRAERVIDARVVAATNVELERAVSEGRFRQDLYFRLRVIEIRVPPLRERRDDIPLLLDFFLSKYAKRLGCSRPILGEGVEEYLVTRSFAGNVRELENLVERALVLGNADQLRPEDFGRSVVADGGGRAAEGLDLKQAARLAAAQTERRLIRKALAETEGNVTRAAETLGLSRRGLQMKIKELGLRSG